MRGKTRRTRRSCKLQFSAHPRYPPSFPNPFHSKCSPVSIRRSFSSSLKDEYKGGRRDVISNRFVRGKTLTGTKRNGAGIPCPHRIKNYNTLLPPPLPTFRRSATTTKRRYLKETGNCTLRDYNRMLR